MAVLTGSTGALRYNNNKVAKVRSWSLTINKDALEDTCLGTYDRSYVQGLYGATGSATILYDPGDVPGSDLLNSIFDNSSSGDPASSCLTTQPVVRSLAQPSSQPSTPVFLWATSKL